MAAAAPSLRINYQARVTDSGGAPYTGTHTLFFSIYQGGTANTTNTGTLVFQESTTATIAGGIASAAIGSGTNLFGGALYYRMFNFSNPMYLQVAVDSPASVVLPRTLLSDQPLAITAFSAFTLDGVTSTAFAAASHTHDASDIVAGTLSDARLSANVSRLGQTISSSEIEPATVTSNNLTTDGASLERVSAGAIVTSGPNLLIPNVAYFGSLSNPVFGNGNVLQVGNTISTRLDQKNEVEAGYLQQTPSPTGQSFTAGLSGNLAYVELLRHGGGGAGTIEIRAGEGTGGAVLTTAPISTISITGWQRVNFSLAPTITAGARYTILFYVSDFQTLYNWHDSDNSNPYAGGAATFNSSADLDFRTFVTGEAPAIAARASTGEVGIGKIPSSGIALDVTGNTTVTGELTVTGQAYKPGGGSWATTSDASVKKNIHTIEGALDKLLRLRGVSFEWKDPARFGNQNQPLMGMVADEVEPVIPEWVKRTSNGLRSLEVIGFEGLTVEAMKDLKRKFDASTRENAELKSEVNCLHRQLDSLDERLSKIESSGTK